MTGSSRLTYPIETPNRASRWRQVPKVWVWSGGAGVPGARRDAPGFMPPKIRHPARLAFEMAVLSQCFSYYCGMEPLGKLPPIRFGHHMADVSAILRIFSGAGRRRIQAAAETPTHGEQAGPGTGNAGNGSPSTLPVFFFFWEGCGDPLLVLPGCAFCSVSVCWRGGRSRRHRTAGTGSGG